MDPVSLAVGGALILVGAAVDRVIRPRRGATTHPKIPSSGATCDCGHSLAFHNEKGCHVTDGYRDKYNTVGTWVGKEPTQCECKQYTGPKVLDPGFVAQEIADAQPRA